eukprot:865252-Amphidinium_carterae.1
MKRDDRQCFGMVTVAISLAHILIRTNGCACAVPTSTYLLPARRETGREGILLQARTHTATSAPMHMHVMQHPNYFGEASYPAYISVKA